MYSLFFFLVFLFLLCQMLVSTMYIIIIEKRICLKTNLVPRVILKNRPLFHLLPIVKRCPGVKVVWKPLTILESLSFIKSLVWLSKSFNWFLLKKNTGFKWVERHDLGLAWSICRLLVAKAGLQSESVLTHHLIWWAITRPVFRCPCRNPNFWLNVCDTEVKGSLEMVLLIEN